MGPGKGLFNTCSVGPWGARDRPGTAWCPWHPSPGYRPSGLRKDHCKEERGQDATSLKTPHADAHSHRLERGWTSSSDLVPLNLLGILQVLGPHKAAVGTVSTATQGSPARKGLEDPKNQPAGRINHPKAPTAFLALCCPAV